MKRVKKDPTAWRNTPEAHQRYLACRAEAQKKADEMGYDYGLEANDIFKTFSHFMLPCAKNRCGHELRCEVVHPMNPDATKAGHGPAATREGLKGVW